MSICPNRVRFLSLLVLAVHIFSSIVSFYFWDVSMKHILFYSRGGFATICSIFETSKQSHFGKTWGGRKQSSREKRTNSNDCNQFAVLCFFSLYIFHLFTRFCAAIARKIKHIETFDPLFGSFILKVFVHFDWNSSIQYQKLKAKMKTLDKVRHCRACVATELICIVDQTNEQQMMLMQ